MITLILDPQLDSRCLFVDWLPNKNHFENQCWLPNLLFNHIDLFFLLTRFKSSSKTEAFSSPCLAYPSCTLWTARWGAHIPKRRTWLFWCNSVFWCNEDVGGFMIKHVCQIISLLYPMPGDVSWWSGMCWFKSSGLPGILTYQMSIKMWTNYKKYCYRLPATTWSVHIEASSHRSCLGFRCRRMVLSHLSTFPAVSQQICIVSGVVFIRDSEYTTLWDKDLSCPFWSFPVARDIFTNLKTTCDPNQLNHL